MCLVQTDPRSYYGVSAPFILRAVYDVAKWDVGDSLRPGFGIPITARANGLSTEQRPAILPSHPTGERGFPWPADFARGESGREAAISARLPPRHLGAQSDWRSRRALRTARRADRDVTEKLHGPLAIWSRPE